MESLCNHAADLSNLLRELQPHCSAPSALWEMRTVGLPGLCSLVSAHPERSSVHGVPQGVGSRALGECDAKESGGW